MKFKAETGEALPQEELERDYGQARDLGKVKVGAKCLYYPRLGSVGYLPCGQVVQAYLRQEEVNARLCCGRANFDQFFLMAVTAAGEVKKAEVLNKDVGKEGLALIAQANPGVKIGFDKKSAEAE